MSEPMASLRSPLPTSDEAPGRAPSPGLAPNGEGDVDSGAKRLKRICESLFGADGKSEPSQKRSGLIWISLIVGNVGLSILIGLGLGEPLKYGAAGWAAALLTTAFAAAPYARFIDNGWWTRHDEFRNELWGEALCEYLSHFWHRRGDEAQALRPLNHGTKPAEDDEQRKTRWKNAADVFDQIYREQYGLGAFGLPLSILLIIIFAETHFFVLTGYGKSAEEILTRLPRITVDTNLSVSAICGAYFFVVGDSVDSLRKESLNSSDVYWYALRMLLAIPIAWALTAPVPDGLKAQVAFALGALPLSFIMKQLRQFASGRKMNMQEAEEADQLIKLDGVTSPTVALLTAEGVTSIDQLLGMDPVLLSIHTGMPFRSVLRLCAQAIVRRHFGDAAFKLSALGLADAPSVYCLVQGLHADLDENGPHWEILKDASNVLKSAPENAWPSQEVVRFAFENVASFAYTHFLMRAGFERRARVQARRSRGADGTNISLPQPNHYDNVDHGGAANQNCIVNGNGNADTIGGRLGP